MLFLASTPKHKIENCGKFVIFCNISETRLNILKTNEQNDPGEWSKTAFLFSVKLLNNMLPNSTEVYIFVWISLEKAVIGLFFYSIQQSM